MKITIGSSLWRYALFLMLFAQAASAFSDEVAYSAQSNCDTEKGIFEITEVRTINGTHTHQGSKYQRSSDSASAPPVICVLGKTKPIKIDITIETSRVNIQGQCGALNGSKQYVLTINDKRKVLFPSAYTRCMGAMPYVRQDTEFKGQTIMPSYLRLTEESLMMIEYDFWRNEGDSPTQFSFTALEYFLAEE